MRIIDVLERGAPFFSFLIGLGIAVIVFHRQYSTIRTLGLPLKDTMDKVVKVDGKCYRYRVEDATCENASTQ